MDTAPPPRHITQREYRRFCCPCPSCGNLFYHCPFDINYQGGGQNPGVPFACDPPVASANGVPAASEEHVRVARAFQAEHRIALSGPTIATTLSKSSNRLVALFSGWFASPSICKAAQRALSACAYIESDQSAAVRGAEAALAIDSLCPDAYYLLARFKAKSYEEALDYFDRGTADYVKLLSDDGWARCRQVYKYVAAAPPLQGAARCMVGAIRALCRMQRGAEAYSRMETLLRVTPPLREEPNEEIWAIAPEVVYRAKGPAACLTWLSEHMCEEVMEVGGMSVWWLATYALAWAATHQNEGFKWSSLGRFEDEAAILGLSPGNRKSSPGSRGGSSSKGGGGGGGSDSECGSDSDGGSSGGPPERRLHWRRILVDRPRSTQQKLHSGLALAACCCWMPHLVDMLLGDIPLPSGPMPPMSVSPASMGAQVAYARYCGDMWRTTPGVLDFVRRYRNTYEVFSIVTDARIGRKPNMADFRRYLAPFPPATPAPVTTAAAVAAKARGIPGNAGKGSSSAPASSAAAAAVSPPPPPASSAGSSALLPGIFPNGLMYEGYGGWHGLVEMACTFTCHHGEKEDATMEPEDLEILRALLATGCPVEASKKRPAGTPGPIHSPLLVTMHRGYGPEVVRELLHAGADPLAPDASRGIPLLSGAEQGMWRELQAVFKARRKLGPSPPPPHLWCTYSARVAPGGFWPVLPRSMFELLLETALASPCAPCVAGAVKGCIRCLNEDDSEDLSGSPHGPWCNFFKVLEVLVAYGMTEVPEPFMSSLVGMAEDGLEQWRRSRLQLLDHLRKLLRSKREELKQQQEQQRKQQQEHQSAGGGAGAAAKEPQQAVLGACNGGTGAQQDKQLQVREEQARETAAAVNPQPNVTTDARGKPSPLPPTPLPQPQTAAVQAKQQQHQQGQQSTDRGPQPAAPAGGAPASQATAAPLAASAGEVVEDKLSDLRLAESKRAKTRCWSCGREKDRAAGVKMRKCSRCYTARYCGDQCQKEHWPQHRLKCKQIAEAEAVQVSGVRGGAE